MLRCLVLSAFLMLSVLAISAAPTVKADGAVSVANDVPLAEDHKIRRKITNKCTSLGTKLSTFIESYSEEKGVEVARVAEINPNASGKVLQVAISDAVSQGNAFIGHRKFVAVEGALYDNGVLVASFDGQRSSGGGFAAGYKSSCAVLGRCVKALGKDIAGWLANPVDDAELGE